MPDLVFDFTWFKDPKGYRLIPAKPIPQRPGQSLLDLPSGVFQPARIVRNGGKLQSYRPLEVFPNLFSRFIDTAKTEEGVLKFVQAFGPLTQDGLRKAGDHVPRIADEASAMGRSGGRSPIKLVAAIVTDFSGIRLKVSPSCLLDALWLQFAQSNTRSRECLQCHSPFMVGVAAGRRADAKFCSDECRISFNSLKRSRS